MTSIFEGQPSKTRPFPSKTRVIWVLGIYYMKKQVLHNPLSNRPFEFNGVLSMFRFRDRCLWMSNENTLPETNIAPENRPSQKENLIFQPLIFRGENVRFREGNTCNGQILLFKLVIQSKKKDKCPPGTWKLTKQLEPDGFLVISIPMFHYIVSDDLVTSSSHW